MRAELELENVAAAIGGQTILRDISLSIAAGRRTVILGPNGSGKSTLLKVMAGLLKYQTGQVRLRGQEISSLGRRELSRQLAVLPQGCEAPADITVSELVEYGRFPHRSLLKRRSSEDREAVEWALERTRLTDYRQRLVRQLSGGERQRAWLAMALAQRPSVLLLDEPTTYLDIAHQLEVLLTVSELNAADKLTVVMVLHDINQAVQFADDAVIIKAGQLAARGAAADILQQSLLKDIFGVQAAEFMLPNGKPAFVTYELSAR